MEFIKPNVAMNCQYHESAGMSHLRSLLIKSCDKLRIHEPITFNVHCFLVFLIDKFNDMNISAVMLSSISKELEDHQTNGVMKFLPTNLMKSV